MGLPSWVYTGICSFGGVFAARAEVCVQKDLILWPSASRKVLGILLFYYRSSLLKFHDDIGEKALCVCKNLKKCVTLLKMKKGSFLKMEEQLFFVFFYLSIFWVQILWSPKTDKRSLHEEYN